MEIYHTATTNTIQYPRRSHNRTLFDYLCISFKCELARRIYKDHSWSSQIIDILQHLATSRKQ